MTKPLPEVILPTMMLTKEKNNGWKSRVVARGDKQPTQEHTDGPTIATSSILMILTIVMSKQYKVVTMDVTGAYLNSDINQHIGVRFNKTESTILANMDPQFKPDNNGRVAAVLVKGLYGLKQSSMLWYNTIRKVLINGCKLQVSLLDPCLFYSESMLLALYVDDILLCYEEEAHLKQLIKILEQEFDTLTKHFLSEENEVKFRGLTLKLTPTTLFIHQQQYITNNIVNEFKKNSCTK